MTLRTLFDMYCELEDQEQRVGLAFSHPALISSELLPRLGDKLMQEKGRRRKARIERLMELDALRRDIAQSASRYPAGAGPVERVAHRVAKGEISLEAGILEVRTSSFALNLAPVYVHVLRWHAEQMAMGGNSEIAPLWARLLAEACLAACPGKEVDERLVIAVVGWIQVAGVALASVPDGEVLQSATELGETLSARLHDSGDLRGEADVLHAMGALYSDPFSSPTGAGRTEADYRVWMRRLEARMGPVLAQRHLEKYPLPEPAEALTRAIEHFERALPHREGAQRGITLKAIAQSLAFRAQCEGRDVDRERIQELCAEALPLLEPGNYHRNTIISLLESLDVPVDEKMVAPESTNTAEGILQRAAALRHEDPAAALRMLLESEEVFESTNAESYRRNRLHGMVLLVCEAHGGDTSGYDGPAAVAAQAAVEAAEKEGWSEDRMGATLLGLAMRTSTTDEEEVGLRLLQIANEQSPTIAGYHAPIAYLYAVLNVGAAVNAVNNGDNVKAMESYALALVPAVRLSLHSMVLEVLARIADLAGGKEDDIAQTVILALAPVVAEIERGLGDAGVQSLQTVYRRVYANLSEPVNGNIVSMLQQLAKGVLFGATLREGPGFDWQEDDDVHERIAEIEAAERQLGEPDVAPKVDEVLLVSSVNSMRAFGGVEPIDRLLNLQQAFDHYLTNRLTRTARKSAILNPEVVQQLVGDRSVLLDYYFAEFEGRQAMHILSYTREEMRLFRNPLVDSPVAYVVDQEDSEAVLDSIGLRTLRLRRALQLDPGEGPLHPEAEQALRDDFELLLGTPTWDYLESLRIDGKDHLCIYPYGALRYYPMHLLGTGDQDLAGRWIVTSIPSLECLLPRTGEKRDVRGRALGLTYRAGEPFGLKELGSADEEVRSIATLFDTEPIMDAEVTEERVIDALRTARHVHLCAHGGHNAGSPLFQCMYVTPDGDSDGLLRAYEILGLDLRGLETLTLGACDSALGRFDSGGNLRGLPATLLSAGTSTIVASLWEALDAAAATFFVTFYTELERGATRLDAFRGARRAVRDAHPKARDWASFCYLGAWECGHIDSTSDLEPYLQLG